MSSATNQDDSGSSDTLSVDFHIGRTEFQTKEDRPCLAIGFDQISKFVITKLADQADQKIAWEFFVKLLLAVPQSQF